MFAVNTEEFLGDDDGNVPCAARRTRSTQMVDGDRSSRRSRAPDFELEADLVLLAMGFVGPERDGPARPSSGVELDERGNVARDDDWSPTSDPACSSPATWAAARA